VAVSTALLILLSQADGRKEKTANQVIKKVFWGVTNHTKKDHFYGENPCKYPRLYGRVVASTEEVHGKDSTFFLYC
jgi:hypothetical protein